MYKMKCEKCKKEHNGSYGSGRFCRSECAHSHIQTKEMNERRSEKQKGKRTVLIKQADKIITFNCIMCQKIFKKRYFSKRRICSDICRNYKHSLDRQKIILKNGTNNFSTKREIFNYKHIKNISCDSKLEKAGIIYLIDIFKADKIERFKNILNFWENEKHRTFNPDLVVIKNNKIYIAEIKMKWIGTSNHTYNRTIPLKKEALRKFCENKNYEMIWLDFDYDDKFKLIYKNLLKKSS